MAKVVKKQAAKKQNSSASSSKKEVSQNNINSENRNISCGNNDSSDDKLIPIRLTNENLKEALIYSEILGKPKCKRRGRCR